MTDEVRQRNFGDGWGFDPRPLVAGQYAIPDIVLDGVYHIELRQRER
ncbi:hypothetical protein [Achromobacter ruhlandii]|nr:hypothetical protein [Achromobacter ruhlandii]